MNPLVNTILGIAFLSSGVLATFLMLWTRGRVASPAARGRRESASPAPVAAAVPPAAASAATESGPRIADRKPMRVQLEKGEHFWCACGASGSQPFCDGSHRGTPYQPLAFTVDEEREAALCLCKHTKKPPYCDGSHARLPESSEPPALPPQSKPTTTSPSAQNTVEEPTLEFIHALARDGLEKTGHHGVMGAMGVPRTALPAWDDLQILTAQLAVKPLAEEEPVASELVIGPRAGKPLRLAIPLLVSDMSFGALSEEAKIALARGAEMVGTGICSGEGGMLPEEQQENSRYLYELGSAKFGYSDELLTRVQAFHFKAGQAAKTGTGGHLPGSKVKGKIARVRNLPEGRPAVSPPTFAEWTTAADFRAMADHVRNITGGIPIGIKMSAQHIEEDLDFALDVGVDYIILDGRGGGTGAAPLLFRDHISVPTIPALVRARRHLNQRDRHDVTLLITGGLRTPADFVKAICLGADGIAIANAAMQAIGCVAARICHSNNCPSGIATQRPELRARFDIDRGAAQLSRFLLASVDLMRVMARACGHQRLDQFQAGELTAWKPEVAALAGVRFAGPKGSVRCER